MNNLSKLTLTILATFSFFQTAYANNLNTLIDREHQRNIKKLGQEAGNEYDFTVLDQRIHYADINRDGKIDAVAETTYCESTSCHPTTNSYVISVFLNTGKQKYRFADNSILGFVGNMNIVNNTIHATAYNYKDSDASCCPTQKSLTKFTVRNGKLVKIR